MVRSCSSTAWAACSALPLALLSPTGNLSLIVGCSRSWMILFISAVTLGSWSPFSSTFLMPNHSMSSTTRWAGPSVVRLEFVGTTWPKSEFVPLSLTARAVVVPGVPSCPM